MKLINSLTIICQNKSRRKRKAQFSSVAQSCLTLCNPVDCSTPGLPVHHQLWKFTRTHVHRVSDAIQPSHPLSSTSPTTFNLSQHQGLFQWVSSSHQVAKGLEFQLQHQFLSLLLFKTLKKIKNLVIKIISGFYGFTVFFFYQMFKEKMKAKL